ncbi:class I SAM-dependent methyltransferase [Litoreibacter roseus]|uniref:Methyltransferase n=1 Tax=Litoreibacter roseus TaxID=2601869 RepID=A0A6N6JB91_9RHOB|nr:class I SAM-dependent methyltransferase [Litoreibacter roseus]GFE63406.1 methyltransferase [Litoreibacter roseus]
MTARDPDENGWASSATTWITRMSGGGDFSRMHVLDRPMIVRLKAMQAAKALDVGCGEGRFCRVMADMGFCVTGLDPIARMLDIARARDGESTYVKGFAESLPFDTESFDLIVSYLTLIDIDDAESAISEMARVLAPGGRILVANLSGFATSSAVVGKRYCSDTGEELRPLGRYLEDKKEWFEWDGLRVQNWHRPLSRYMHWFLANNLALTHFDEPRTTGGPADRLKSYERMPYLMIMEWQKPF